MFFVTVKQFKATVTNNLVLHKILKAPKLKIKEKIFQKNPEYFGYKTINLISYNYFMINQSKLMFKKNIAYELHF